MKFTIYTKPNCSYCEQAKTLLLSRGQEYEELILDTGQIKLPEKTYVTVHQLKSRVPSAQTVPQIFKGEDHIGGYDALKMLMG